MELLHYITVLRKRLWIIILVAALFGGIGYFYSHSQEPVYDAQSLVLIGGAIQSVNPDPTQIETSLELVQVYAVLAKTTAVLEKTLANVGAPLSVKDFSAITSVSVLEATPLLIINVSYNDPIIAAELANELAEQLKLAGPSALSSEEQRQITFLSQQIDTLSAQLTDTRAQLDVVNQQLESTTNQLDFDRLLEQRNNLVTQINEASLSIAEFSSTLASLQQRSNTLEIVEYAQVPAKPSNPSLAIVTILGAVIGGALAVGAVLLSDYLDDTIGSPQEARTALQMPVIGAISNYSGKLRDAEKNLITLKSPLSAAAQQYRMLQANLLAETQSKNATFLITSPTERDGKTTTAVNLGVAIASTGLRVILIDFNLRQPALHRYFRIPNDRGVITLLTTETTSVPADGNSDFKPRVLVIEDDPDTRKLIGIQLTKANLESVLVPDGNGAFEEIQRQMPDLVLLDVMLSDISGYQIAERIREEYPATRLPIIMLSALGGRVEDRIRGLQAGANDFMAKPYTSEELLTRINTLLNFTRLQSESRVHLPDVAAEAVHETDIPNLWVMPTGEVKGKAALVDAMSLLHQFQEWAKVIRSHLQIDVMVLDSPACLVSADSTVLAAATNAAVLMVLESGKTKKGVAVEALEQFRHIGVEIGGIIMNKSSII